MTFKQQITILIAIISVVLLTVLGVLTRDTPLVEEEGKKEEVQEIIQVIPVKEKEVVTFTTEVPKNTKITTPVEEKIVSKETGIRLGAFEIVISRSGFSPDTITVPVGDIAELRVRAEDDDYDIAIPYYGTYAFIEKGEEKKPGSF